ncbi:MAG: DUF1015 domain-containing protein [Clostridia bacterium]|nr:DUF1015 domain-containing protein [Clostridia bacterium]
MERILPLKALRYNKNFIGDIGAVLAPPYDVISAKQQQSLYNSHPFNVVRLECGMENDGDSETDNKYTRSAETLDEWTLSGVIVPDRQPAIYVYHQEYTAVDGENRVCKGIVCLVRLDDFEIGTVLPHEETGAKAKSDRLKLLGECGVNFSPVFGLYRDDEKTVDTAFEEALQNPPDTFAKTIDGASQKVWTVTDEETAGKIQQLLADKQIIIADGHHRYEAALKYRDMMIEINPDHTGEEPYNYVMMYLAEMNQPGFEMFATHRLVRNVVGYSEAGVISQLEKSFNITKLFAEEIETAISEKLAENNDIPTFAMYTGKDYYYLLRLKDFSFADAEGEGKSVALRHLDVTVLHSLILGKAFGVSEAELKKQDYLSFTRNIEEAAQNVKNGDFQCAFMINPTKMQEIFEISLNGEKMPQKSTWISPKPKTGLVMNKIN